MPSPELGPEHLLSGQASPAAATMFRFAAARAAGLGDDAGAVQVLSLRVAQPPQAVQRQVSSVGPLVVDIHMDFCVRGMAQLPHGADFERAFAIATQEFAAFHPSALRLLSLEDTTSGGRYGQLPAPSPQPAPPSHRQQDLPKPGRPEEGLGLPEGSLFWLAAAGLAAAMAAGVGVWLILVRRRRAKRMAEELSDAVAISGLDAPGAAAAVHGERHVTTVLAGFDPTTQDAGVFAAADGLEASECLKVAPGDVVEVIALGDGWLYGRLIGPELFGYVPTECVQRVPHTPPASAAVMEAGLVASVAAAAA